MPEYIDREAVYRKACRGCARSGDEIGTCYEEEPCTELEFEFSSAPAVDVVPVVRCKDCEHLELRPELPGVPFCRVWQNAVAIDEFCRRGKRRVDGGGVDA